MKKILLTYFILTICAGLLQAQEEIEIGIDEQLGAKIPADATFLTAAGDTVKLGDVLTKPTLLSLVYYECPGICSPLTNELAWAVERLDLAPGEDFQIVSLSFDPRETPKIASRWKKNYLQSMRREFHPQDWLFLTSDSANIAKVTEAIGFRYKMAPDSNYVHPGVLVAVSPNQKISRYIFGSDYNQFDLKMALLDAEAGKTQPTIAKVLQFCFSYDPQGRTYSLNITRIVGIVMLLTLGLIVATVTLKKPKKPKSKKYVAKS